MTYVTPFSHAFFLKIGFFNKREFLFTLESMFLGNFSGGSEELVSNLFELQAFP